MRLSIGRKFGSKSPEIGAVFLVKGKRRASPATVFDSVRGRPLMLADAKWRPLLPTSPPSHDLATYGCSATTGFCAEMRVSRAPSSGFWALTRLN
jgi:hypothetical protein